MRIVPNSAYVSEGPLYEIMGEDSMLVVFDYFVEVTGVDGSRYQLNKYFKGWSENFEGIPGVNGAASYIAKKLSESVNARGYIKREHWHEIEPSPASYALGEVDEVSLMDDEERMHKGY